MISEELCEEIILDHHKHPRNFRALEPCDCAAQGVNTSCGDEVKVYVRRGPTALDDVAFTGQGCAISRASASLMTVRCKGRSEGDARALAECVRAMLVAEGPEVEGDLAALAGVRKFPARVKCALLPWRALEAALDGRREAVST
ncbi:MAG: Fe-S cluster assembly sulfur transfer protein SufU [Chthoniobacterales bacterium]